VAKNDNLQDMSLLESCVRDDLNEKAPRVMGVLRPLKLVIDNYAEGQTEVFDAANHPQNPEFGTRKVPFSKVLYIEQDDFMEEVPKKYKRLGPGREVRLRNAYVVKYASHVKDPQTGEVTEVHCTYDPTTRDGAPADGRKVEGVIHWLSAAHAVPADVRLYDRLFRVPNPATEGDGFTKHLNPGSLGTVSGFVEASLASAAPGSRYQFERLGYFCVDTKDASPGRLVFNRVVALRDSWSKLAGAAT
jgi:glutaminyl-tRNA synthetase